MKQERLNMYTTCLSVPEPKIIGETNEQLITPEALLAGTAKQNIEKIVALCSLTDDFDGWLYWQVLNAYTHNICTSNKDIDVGELLRKECYICNPSHIWNEKPVPINDMYGLNYSKLPLRFKDNKFNKFNDFNNTRLDKPIVKYIQNNGWFYSTTYGVNDTAGAIIDYVYDKGHEEEFNDRFIKKLFTQWFNRYVLKNHSGKNNDDITIEIPHKEIPSLFLRLTSVKSIFADTIADLLYKHGWSYDGCEPNKVAIMPYRIAEENTDNVKLYSPKNMPDFAYKAKTKAKLLKDFTLWFNQELKGAYLDKSNGEQCADKPIVVNENSISINCKAVPKEFTITRWDDSVTLKSSVLKYLLDNDWNLSAITDNYWELNL